MFPDRQALSAIKRLGIDLVSIPRIARLIDQNDRETLTLVFTLGEIDRCRSDREPHRAFAILFATKEAVGKALGTGLVGIDWHEIEAKLTPDFLTLQLSGNAYLQAQHWGIETWWATWCHWDDHVLVQVIAL